MNENEVKKGNKSGLIIGICIVIIVILLAMVFEKNEQENINQGELQNNQEQLNQGTTNKTEEKKKDYIVANLNELVVVPDMAEITFTSVSVMDEIKPPDIDGVYSYYQDKDGEKYIVLKGTFKNLLTTTFDDFSNFEGKLKLNDKYEYPNVNISFASETDDDFYSSPKSLQTITCYVWVSVPDDIVTDSNNTFDYYLDFKENYNDETPQTVKFTFKF
ncbi:MAG: hypothetical protein IJE68_04930 [Clostridia bacterium]|nr:hypothetical protein [Clostridia bacterium]